MQAEDPPQNLIPKRKHGGVQVGQDCPNMSCPQNPLCHKVCLLILSIELCLWNKYSKILVNKCWRLLIL
jgi:hypothetical protein